MELYKKLNRDFGCTDENERIYEAYLKVINEDATADALKSLKAIIGMFKNAGPLKADSKDMLEMAEGMMKSYEKNKGFSKDQANWIYKTSKALFK